jgi:hypothetical protein
MFNSVAANTRLYGDSGAVFAKQLATTGQHFYVLSHDPQTDQVVAQKARIEGAARGMVMQVRTNCGTYEVSQAQSFRLDNQEVIPATSLKPGDKLQSCDLENVAGFIYVHYNAEPVPLHELVDSEMSGMFRLSLPVHILSKAKTIQEVMEVSEGSMGDISYMYITSLSKNEAVFTSSHNYLLWPDGTSFGSGIFVH